MKNVTVIKHPLLQHKLAFLRDKTTDSAEFRRITKEVSKYIAYEASRELEQEKVKIETPIASTTVEKISKPPIVVSIMRAGNGMLDSVLEAMPFAGAGHIGIYRDKFIHNTVEYYFKIPDDCKGKPVFLLDPLIATGDTALASIDRLKNYEVGSISLLSLLASEEGLQLISEAHPDVRIFTLEIEKEMNENKYLVPGLGDAGDRLFRTC
ncbi:MAG: uracil phosphoribosyltransferase [Bdellovibrionales bacterium]